VLGLEDFTEADIEALRKVEPPASAAEFDHEVEELTTPRSPAPAKHGSRRRH
jgi:hypothetical protein